MTSDESEMTMIRCTVGDGEPFCVNHNGYSGPSAMCPACGAKCAACGFTITNWRHPFDIEESEPRITHDYVPPSRCAKQDSAKQNTHETLRE